jgi:hypothetical protein
MNTDNNLFDQPENLRWWLLCKALESASLEEALKLARAAIDFLMAAPSEIGTEPAVEKPTPNLSAPEISELEVHPTSLEDEGTAADQPLSEDDLQLLINDRLAVLASNDDVVRYLRQRDDVVVSAGDRKFLVNGRLRLELGELVTRANRMRERHGKPRFELLCLRMNGGDQAINGKQR